MVQMSLNYNSKDELLNYFYSKWFRIIAPSFSFIVFFYESPQVLEPILEGIYKQNIQAKHSKD